VFRGVRYVHEEELQEEGQQNIYRREPKKTRRNEEFTETIKRHLNMGVLLKQAGRKT